jgi:predicted negative regulator of RcsB-dependent stress response
VNDRTEEEQVDALKKWFAKNGISLVVAIVLGVGGSFGYKTWEASVREGGEKASALFENLTSAVSVGPLDELSDEDKSTAKYIARELKADYADSTYAHFAAMHLARIAVEDDDLDKAATELQWVLDQNVDLGLAALVRLRLAQVKLAQGEFEDGLVLVDATKAGAHGSAFAETRGDIFYAMEQFDNAREAYQMAVNTQVEGSAKPMLQMKLDDLVPPQLDIPVVAEEKGAEEKGADESSADELETGAIDQ